MSNYTDFSAPLPGSDIPKGPRGKVYKTRKKCITCFNWFVLTHELQLNCKKHRTTHPGRDGKNED